jgi:hypothetical protein
MALAAIQALYDDDDEIDLKKHQKEKEDIIEDQMAVINDPAFSIMSKIKLNLTPAIAIQVKIKIPMSSSNNFCSFLARRHQQFS